MKTLKLLLIGLLQLTLSATLPAQFATLKGSVNDHKTGEPIPFANIVLKSGEGKIITGASSDIKGFYLIKPIKPGVYNIECGFTGYAKATVKDIELKGNAITLLNFRLREESEHLDEVIIIREAPLISKTKSSMIMTAEDISPMAVRDMSSVSAEAAGTVSSKTVSTAIRCSRSEGTVYFIDGIKVRGTVNLPQSAIAQTEVITGGLPAQYGDHPSPLEEYGIDFISPQEICFAKKREGSEESEPSSGILTAGEIHDFSKWELWEDLSKDELKVHQEHWKTFPAQRFMLQLTFPSGGAVVDARVRLVSRAGKTLWETHSDNTGKAELWQGFFNEDEKVSHMEVAWDGLSFSLEDPKTFKEGMNILEIPAPCGLTSGIDISFVVDATGSMADEIAYLKTELKDVISRVQQQLQKKDLRLGSVFYRDVADEYVTRYSDFSSNISKTIDFIRNQSAGGGGDYPEAVLEALQVALEKMSWRETASARILFLILDAPPHYDEEKLKELHRLMALAAAKGVRVVPIASSGIDKSTEYLLRSMALATNGTYTFLTDDSGVGNPHIKPSTDTYKVELLNDLLVRLIHQFSFVPPCPEPVLSVSADSIPKVQVDLNLEDRDLPPSPENFNWEVFPNPTTGPLQLRFSKKVSELFLTDLRGKILSRINTGSSKEFRLDLSPYPVGTYFIRFQWEDQWHTEQIILRH